MENNNFSGYFLYCGKWKKKSSLESVPEKIEKVNIDGYLFVFILDSLRESAYHNLIGLKIQFFTWVVIKKISIILSKENWTIHINVDNIEVQDNIEEISSKISLKNDKFWEDVANLIISNYSIWPNKIEVEPATNVQISFTPPFSEEQIIIKYGERIYLEYKFFNKQSENLKVFLKAYFASIREEIAV
jgi:hypothetical protein